MPVGLIAIKANEKLKRNKELNKKGKLLNISKRQMEKEETKTSTLDGEIKKILMIKKEKNEYNKEF